MHARVYVRVLSGAFEAHQIHAPSRSAQGNVLSYLERLDDEFYKSLQLLEPHAPEYVARLKDEVPLVNLMQDTLAFYDTKTDESSQKDMARVASRIVEHVYYREQVHVNMYMHMYML